MDLKEFRIGNLLLMGGNHWQEEGEFELREITGQEIGHPFISEFIKPIPLTEDWLMKFGFEKDKKHKGYYQFNIAGFGLQKRFLLSFYFVTIDEIDKRYCYIFECGIGERIQYVHQLQNLYFSLTGTEIVLSAEGKSLIKNCSTE